MQRSEEEIQKQYRYEVDTALDHFVAGLKPFVVREMEQKHGLDWEAKVSHMPGRKPNLNDPSALLGTMLYQWRDVFQDSLGHKGRNLVGELKEWRSFPAHRDSLSHEDVIRSLDSMVRLLELVAPLYQLDGTATNLQKLKSRKLELEIQRLEHLISPSKESAKMALKPMVIQRTREFATASETEEAKILHPVVLLRIDRSYRFGMTEDQLYEATRGDWALAPEKRQVKPQYALAVVSFVIREVYVIDTWYPALGSLWGPNRWRFDGLVATNRADFVGKNVQTYINRRSSNPAQYVNC
jgi:hypothetical protein